MDPWRTQRTSRCLSCQAPLFTLSDEDSGTAGFHNLNRSAKLDKAGALEGNMVGLMAKVQDLIIAIKGQNPHGEGQSRKQWERQAAVDGRNGQTVKACT